MTAHLHSSAIFMRTVKEEIRAALLGNFRKRGSFPFFGNILMLTVSYHHHMKHSHVTDGASKVNYNEVALE